jgi:CDP-glucose 4,6-dehydratase
MEGLVTTMPLNIDFWKSRRVLITGDTGFKGSWLCLWLYKLGANVYGLANGIPTQPSMFELTKIKEHIAHYDTDIRDLDRLKDVINKSQPEIVIHLAAQSLVRASYQNPVETYATNILGTVNLLEAIRCNGGVKACINVTTDKCYENNEWHHGYREIDRLGGHDPYSSSKACSEIITNAYRKSYFSGQNKPALATARAGNVIGGGDWATDRLIPDIFKGWLSNKAILIRNPNAVRPWQHVLEALYGYMLLAEKLVEQPEDFSQAWNFGPYESDARSVSWIAAQLKEQLTDIQLEIGSSPGLHEATFLKLDSSKARAEIGWRPQLRLSECLQMVIKWYKACRNNDDLKNFSLAQIQTYMEKIQS